MTHEIESVDHICLYDLPEHLPSYMIRKAIHSIGS